MQSKGIYEYEGFGFKFGMYSVAILEKEAGCKLNDVLKRMNTEGEQTMALLQYFYSGAVSWAESKGLSLKVTKDLVADWIEKMGEAEASRVLLDSLGLPKNSEAPKETGQTKE